MLTVLEAIKLSTEYLEKKGIESPRTNAELFLADIIGCKRLDLYLKFDRPVSEDERLKYREFIARRGKLEPLQYILGYVEFYGLKFFVDPSVLIPRQETEILVEKIINENKNMDSIRVLDIGTGTGNIPVSLRKNLPSFKFLTIDISSKAIDIAKKNIKLHEFEDDVEVMHFDILNGQSIEQLGKFDMIVSNPPYVDEEQYNTLQKEITEHEPKEAVSDFGDGYSFYKKISELSTQLLNPKGKIYFEVGIGQADRVKDLLADNGMSFITSHKDYLDIDRVVYGEIG
ncbi:MAG: peptide chain release factor N(5)-glutamine methyltransferase [Bacteroidetes bacterium]|nr:peptide chain release factor N(5)-glutamine methyltransferase [Bacteroidota bacterium]